MGGFVGLFGAEDAARARRMARALDARGPTARWEWFGSGCAFVVVGSGVAQPGSPVGEAEGVVAAVDGHVPHTRVLAAELDLPEDAGLGVIVAVLVARTGFLRAVARLPGEVAVAAWVPAERRGWVARDRTGTRSLAWAVTSAGLAFATEARALSIAGLAGEPDPRALAEAVSLGALAPPRSVRSGASMLQPGGLLTCESGETRASPGPRFVPHPAGAAGNFDRWTRSARYGLDLAYAAQARVATPHALALGGGLASAAMLATRPRDSGPTVALTVRVGGRVEPGVVDLARSAGLALREVTFGPAEFAELADEVAPHPAWVRPEAWAWAALARAAWREGAVGLATGVGARQGFDPPESGPLANLRSRTFRRLGPRGTPAERLAAAIGGYAPGDVLELAGLAAELPVDAEAALAFLSRQLALPEAELAALDAGCAAFGLEAITPFADPAFLQVVLQIPTGVHHRGARRALLAAVAGRPAPSPAAMPLPLAELIQSFDLDMLPTRLQGLLDPTHVRAVVAAARGGDPGFQRRVFALEMIARGLVG